MRALGCCDFGQTWTCMAPRGSRNACVFVLSAVVASCGSVANPGAPVFLSVPVFDMGSSLSAGVEYSVSTTALTGAGGSPVAGLTIAFSSSSGVSFSPSSTATDLSGAANSTIVVPYGSEILAVVSGGGTVNTQASPRSPAVTLSMPQFDAEQRVSAGQEYSVSTTATLGPDGGAVAGLAISFASSTTGIAFTPATAFTDPNGIATSTVLAPYGAQILAVVSGGGAVNAQASPLSEAGITLSLIASPSNAALNTYAVTATAQSSGAAVAGVTVSFALLGSGPLLTISPSSLLTDSSGNATVYALNSTDAGVLVTATAVNAVAIAVVP